MKKNVEYWLKRLADNRMYQYHKDADKTIMHLIKSHEKAAKEIQKEISKIFDKYKKDMSYDEALNLLNEYIPNDEYDKLLDLYKVTKDKGLKNQLKKRLNAQAYRSRIQRKEAMQETLYRNAIKKADTEIGLTSQMYRKFAEDNYYKSMFDFQRVMGAGFAFNGISQNRLNVIMNTKWSGEHFSSRVWKNSQAVSEKAYEAIESGMLSGKSMRHVAQEIQHLTDMGKYASERLVRTETTYIVNEADRQSAIERGIKQRQFIATLDFKTSEKCQSHHLEKYDVDKLVPGKNQPPLHPHCRSMMIDVIEGLEHKFRRVRNPETGKNEIVPFDMSYDQWKEKYVKKEDEWKFKAAKNESADRSQFERYKSRLRDEDIPKSFTKFQEIKYSENQTSYGLMKTKYKAVGIYDKAVERAPGYDNLIKDVGNNTGMKTAGLEYSVKSKDSYLRKVETNYLNGKVNYEVKDINRYTLIGDSDNLTDKTLKSFDVICEKGYNISEVKNTWYDGSSYKGINTVIRDSEGNPFELQFHTQESFALKNGKLHELYEKQRVLQENSTEWLELQEEMIELSKMISNPKKINQIRK